jgi:hypothetical protein
MDEWTNLERALQELAGSGSVEVHEDGEWLAELAGIHCELHRHGKNHLVHVWSQDRNLVRRILRVVENTPGRLALEVQRFGRPRPGKLEFLRTDIARPAARLDREKFRARFRRMLAEQFPDTETESLTTAPDLEHSFSGLYTRGVMVERGRSFALLGAWSGEDRSTIEDALSFGLLWLDWTRQHAQRRALQGLRLFLPAGLSGLALHRARALAPSANLEIYEMNEDTWRVERAEIADAGNLESWLTPRGEAQTTLDAAREAIEKIRALATQSRDAIAATPAPGTREVALRFRGLEFARWDPAGVSFGLGDDQRELSPRTWPELEKLVQQLELNRSPLASDTNHPLYRAAPERWLETLALADPSRIDAQLDPRCIYSQVPAFSAGDRGVMDLVGVTRQGRLVVIELKASEDIHLPLQALDYWLRVRRHHHDGDFQRCGYFSGIELDARPPLLWLVAPGLRFHPSAEILLRYLSPEVQVTRIGLNENWRRGLQVIFRQ